MFSRFGGKEKGKGKEEEKAPSTPAHTAPPAGNHNDPKLRPLLLPDMVKNQSINPISPNARMPPSYAAALAGAGSSRADESTPRKFVPFAPQRGDFDPYKTYQMSGVRCGRCNSDIVLNPLKKLDGSMNVRGYIGDVITMKKPNKDGETVDTEMAWSCRINRHAYNKAKRVPGASTYPSAASAAAAMMQDLQGPISNKIVEKFMDMMREGVDVGDGKKVKLQQDASGEFAIGIEMPDEEKMKDMKEKMKEEENEDEREGEILVMLDDREPFAFEKKKKKVSIEYGGVILESTSESSTSHSMSSSISGIGFVGGARDAAGFEKENTTQEFVGFAKSIAEGQQESSKIARSGNEGKEKNINGGTTIQPTPSFKQPARTFTEILTSRRPSIATRMPADNDNTPSSPPPEYSEGTFTFMEMINQPLNETTHHDGQEDTAKDGFFATAGQGSDHCIIDTNTPSFITDKSDTGSGHSATAVASGGGRLLKGEADDDIPVPSMDFGG
ncbi:hypothetical protein ABW19_dt0200877 [Dactylella cylindrospora]|nr:hypothetical protein ABW19_dt0200877 [Dactylella cylindrospora]